ncbi:MAG: ABC transporter permease [Anaerolineae bacterium]
MTRERFEYILIPVVFVLAISLWRLIIRLGDYPPFILPPPERVWAKLVRLLADGSLIEQAKYTSLEAFLGFVAAFLFGTVMGYILAKSPLLEKLIQPYIVASRGIPVIAIAPLLVIWFGFGITSKVFVCFFIVFFPMLITTIIGIREVSEEKRELMHSYSASPWQVFSKLEVPSALPVLLGGVKLGVTSSVMGAVVGEFVGADRGLGFWVNLGKGQFDTTLIFVSIAALVVLSLTVYISVWVLEGILLKGRRRVMT